MKKNVLAIFALCGVIGLCSESFAQSFDTGVLGVTSSNGGRVRVYAPNTTADKQIERLSALVGMNSTAVFDYNNDADAESPAVNVVPSLSDFEIFSVLNNKYPTTPVPPDVFVRTNIYGWTNEGYAIFCYTVTNNESAAFDAVIGYESITRVDGTYENDTIYFDSVHNSVVAYENTYVGYKFLSTPLTSARILKWYSGYSDSEADLYSWLTYNAFDTAPLATDVDGAIVVMAGDAVNIAPGDSASIYFAVAVGSDETSMWNNMAAAQAKYNTVLPVELTSFTAAQVNNQVNLKWNTATEINNRGFEIERRTDKAKWGVVGFESGNGTTTESKSYAYSDDISNVKSSKIYYRLKQIDLDGTFSYSSEIEVSVVNIPEQFSLDQNYPNPFNPTTKIKYSIPAMKNAVSVQLKVYDIIGNEVTTLVNQEQSAGSYEVDFNAAGLSSGMYFYSLTAGNFSSTKKMILIK